MFNFNFAKNGIMPLQEDAKYSMFLYETAKLIYNTGYFRVVEPRVRKNEAVNTPACYLYPTGVRIIEQALIGFRQDVRYTITIGIAEKHPNDAILLQKILSYAQKIRKVFSLSRDSASSVLLFSTIDGHYNTVIEGAEIEPIEQISDDTIIFSSGVNLVYYSWDDVLNM